MTRTTLEDLFDIQKSFNDSIYGPSPLCVSSKEEITKSLCLAVHAEVSDLISSLNYKEHYDPHKKIKKEKILYESVDIVRYTLAIMNLWDFSSDDFLDAFLDKDNYLLSQRRQQNTHWDGQPVLIVDLDDVLVKFREGFVSWLEETYKIDVDKDSEEYYTTREVIQADLNPEEVFNQFILNRKIKSLEPESDMIQAINYLKKSGFWIHLLTARPDNDLQCFYDTYTWLETSGLSYDKLSFNGEKYRWCTQSEYFDSGSIVCAIDDSPKHAAEYAKHGLPVYVPYKSYNLEVHDMKNVYVFKDAADLLRKIKKL